MESSKKCKVGVIGCGRIAGHHLRSIQSVDRLKISAVCDMDLEKAKNYGDIFKVPHFTDYNIMLNDIPEIDLVVIATPSGMHYEHALDIMTKFKKNIVVEKPTFMRTDQLQNAYKIASERNTFNTWMKENILEVGPEIFRERIKNLREDEND